VVSPYRLSYDGAPARPLPRRERPAWPIACAAPCSRRSGSSWRRSRNSAAMSPPFAV